jgi:hypothetical protein
MNNTNMVAMNWALGITPIYNTETALLSQT